MLAMDSINWRYLLSHPSEFVRIDEQLRLLQITLREFNQNLTSDEWTQETFEVNKIHIDIINNFRMAVNILGCNIFDANLFSPEEQHNLHQTIIKTEIMDSIMTHSHSMPLAKFCKLLNAITDKKWTEKLFQHFLIFIFDNHVSMNNQLLLLAVDSDKESIMNEIIKKIV